MVDVLAAIAVLAVLAAIILPELTRDERPLQTYCTASMKQVAIGYILWAQDSEKGQLPFQVPYAEGGLKDPGTNRIQISGIGNFDPQLRSNAWLQYLFIHKELHDPKVLLCPADKEFNKKRKPATSWGLEKGGLVSPGMQNNSLSYCLNLDAGLSPDGKSIDLTNSQTHVLLTERHMAYDTVNSACSANVGPTKVVKLKPQSGTNPLAHVVYKADPKLHGQRGNVALLDGSVHQANAKQTQELLGQNNDNGELHFIYP